MAVLGGERFLMSEKPLYIRTSRADAAVHAQLDILDCRRVGSQALAGPFFVIHLAISLSCLTSFTTGGNPSQVDVHHEAEREGREKQTARDRNV